MSVCLLVVKTYDKRLQDTYANRFGRFAQEHIRHIEATLGHPDSTIADIVVMPEGFGAAYRMFEELLVEVTQ